MDRDLTLCHGPHGDRVQQEPRFGQDRTVQASGSTLHVRVAGDPGSGNVLIALHGGPGMSSDYMVSLEQLASAQFAVVTYDQRGTGRSTSPKGSRPWWTCCPRTGPIHTLSRLTI